MLKITHAGCLGLFSAISLQFTVKMCAAAKKLQKTFNKTSLLGVQGRLRSSMLTNLKSPSPLLVMICSKSVLTCNRFHTIKTNNGKITLFRGGTLL